MWTSIKNNYKIILTTVVILFVGIVLAILFENYYRQLVRFSFKFFNGDKIQFVGKNFHLFASYFFVTAFGIFISLSFILFNFSTKSKRIKRACFTIIIFFCSTIFISALDCYGLIIECTACDDGIRKLSFNQPSYDNYFVISLTISFAYLLTTFLLECKPLGRTNKSI